MRILFGGGPLSENAERDTDDLVFTVSATWKVRVQSTGYDPAGELGDDATLDDVTQYLIREVHEIYGGDWEEFISDWSLVPDEAFEVKIGMIGVDFDE